MESKLHSMTDTELAVLSQQGNAEAFNKLAQRWGEPLFRFVRRTLGNDEDARDTCQDTFVKAYTNIARLKNPERFKSWLHHIALNLCRDRYRAAKVRSAQEYEEGLSESFIPVNPTVEKAPDRTAERTNLGEILTQVVDQLSPDQKTAILLREYQGFSTEEIAQITGVPAATVRTRIFYGLKTMRKLLPEYGVTNFYFQNGVK
jgi:RNA polymerase sigma-70 factor, ECF subfamily